MQYFGRAIDSVSKTWSSINPATLSGAIDVIVVEHEDGTLNSSPFHVRFGKFQLLRPSQKKVTLVVNGQLTDIPMKLGDGGEAFFVFKTDGYVPIELQTSPVISPVTSPETSPKEDSINDDMAYLDIGEGEDGQGPPQSAGGTDNGRFQRIQKKLTKVNIPSKVNVNGDIILDMDGYKSDNRDVKDSEEFMRQIIEDEFGKAVKFNDIINKDLDGKIRISSPSPDQTVFDSTPSDFDVKTDDSNEIPPNEISDDKITPNDTKESDNEKNEDDGETYFFTLRLTSEQLKALPLIKGKNSLQYSVGKSTVVANLFLWDAYPPIVISDIDGTITKSDAMGHVMTMLGRDWTHEGVAQLFKEIKENGYNIMYLTARSVGLADSTRSYLAGIDQDNIKLPDGPVILSPDRTFQALKREIVLKKPEVFKMACLNDIRKLYFTDLDDEDCLSDDGGSWDGRELLNSMNKSAGTDLDDWSDINTNTVTGTGTGSQEANDLVNDDLAADDSSLKGAIHEDFDDDYDDEEEIQEEYNEDLSKHDGNTASKISKHHLLNPHHHIPNEDLTPFYAGFGNRITDAISYRSVGIPSSRIFTIDPEGDVKMELLEMAGYKCSYVSIGELVDQFFPLLKQQKKKQTTLTPEPIGSSSNSKGSADEGATSPLHKTVFVMENGFDDGLETNKASVRNIGLIGTNNTKNKFTDFNYWRPDEVDWSLISESDDEDEDVVAGDNNEKGQLGTKTMIESNHEDVDEDITGSILVHDDDNASHVHMDTSHPHDDTTRYEDDEGWDNEVPQDDVYDYEYDDYDEARRPSTEDGFTLTRILSPRLGFWRSSDATTATSEVNVDAQGAKF